MYLNHSWFEILSYGSKRNLYNTFVLWVRENYIYACILQYADDPVYLSWESFQFSNKILVHTNKCKLQVHIFYYQTTCTIIPIYSTKIMNFLEIVEHFYKGAGHDSDFIHIYLKNIFFNQQKVKITQWWSCTSI